MASSSSSNNNNGKKRGMDALIQAKGKALETGQSVVFSLVKGPPLQQASADPVDPKAPPESFPLVAKFPPESVAPPRFDQAPWKAGARWYQQDVPKPVADSDDDNDDDTEQPKKRWKYGRRRREAPARQWILQEQVDFLETMVAQREHTSLDLTRISTRYEGQPEHNPSRYCLLLQKPNDDNDNSIQVCLLPTPNAVVAFSQPAARQTLSLAQAEQVLEDSRAGICTTLLQHQGGGAAASASERLTLGRKPPNTSKNRLLNKLQSAAAAASKDEEDDDGDDVMGDVAFRKKSRGGARKELLSSVAGGDVLVSEEGVLGGTNDVVFGGRQRFGRINVETANAEDPTRTGAKEGLGTTERGADGAAMQEDFYQRDVKAEYDEMDFDANELFDDDDVDVGESEVVVDPGGYADPGEEAVTDESDHVEEEVAGAAGLASAAGFKAMLAKARGEVTVQAVAEEALAGKKDKEEDAKAAAKGSEADDFLAKSMAAAEKTAAAAKKRADQPAKAKSEVPVAPSAPQVDENGLRIVSLGAVRNEIWLHHGSIPMKRLMKIFEIKKKGERQEKFREVVKELCTMRADPINGRMLVLKQHYSKNG